MLVDVASSINHIHSVFELMAVASALLYSSWTLFPPLSYQPSDCILSSRTQASARMRFRFPVSFFRSIGWYCYAWRSGEQTCWPVWCSIQLECCRGMDESSKWFRAQDRFDFGTLRPRPYWQVLHQQCLHFSSSPMNSQRMCNLQETIQ